MFVPGKIYPGVIKLKGFYIDSVQTVNSTQYEEVFQNTTMFVSDDVLVFFCLFNAILNVMQTEGIHAAFNVKPRMVSLEKSTSFNEYFTTV